MLEDYERKKRKQISLMRSMMDYTMGTIILLIGTFFFFRNRINIWVNDYLRPPDALDKLLGVICILYGSWRIYRGFQKKYFR